MAILVAVGGALLGSAVGIGASAGWLIGSLIGTFLFPSSSGRDQEGPRLGDLSVTSSAAGAPIPIGYGTVRLGGNMIWSTGIEEVKHEEEVEGGKGGGGSQTITTYEYFCSFALGFAEGPCDDLLRIWADGKVIYDKTGQSGSTSAGLKFRLYRGTEEQGQDSLIVADKGTDGTPAYRGLVYVVFDRLPLKDFGNRIPNITAEITFNKVDVTEYQDTDFYTDEEGGISGDNFQGPGIIPDFKRGYYYAANASINPGDNVLRRFKLGPMVEDQQRIIPVDANGNEVLFLNVVGVTSNGYVLVISGATNRKPLSLVDPDSLEIVSTFGVPSPTLDNSPTGFETTHYSAPIQAGSEHFMLTGSTFNSVGLVRVTNGVVEYVWHVNYNIGVLNGYNILGVTPGARGISSGDGYYLLSPPYILEPVTTHVVIHKVKVNAASVYDPATQLTVGVEDEAVIDLAPEELLPGEEALAAISGPVYDSSDDTLLVEATSEDGKRSYMIKVSPHTGGVVWRTLLPDGSPQFDGVFAAPWNERTATAYIRIGSGVYGQMTANDGFALNTSDGSIFFLKNAGWPVSYSSNTGGWWDAETGSFTGGRTGAGGQITRWFFFRGNGEGTTLDVIVADLCRRVGLNSPDDIDVSDLASVPVPGYMVTRLSTIRTVIEQLASFYIFDGVESDYKIKFTLRDGKSPVATIAQYELAVLSEETGEFYRETRQQEVELPMRVTITYMDRDNDYQQQAHSAKRMVRPTRTMYSSNEVQLQVPVVEHVDKAKRQAEAILFGAWVERQSYAVKVPSKFLFLDPADVITVELEDGASLRMRLTQTDIGLEMSVDMSGVAEDSLQYTSSVVGDGGDGPLDHPGPGPTSFTRLVMLFAPLLRDADDTGRSTSVVYYMMGGYGQDRWDAGLLYGSAEGTQYSALGSATNEMQWGTCGNALGDTDTPFATDEDNILRVHMVTGTGLFSVTQLEMLNGANAAAIVHRNRVDLEIIQFRDVTQNLDGSFSIRGLLRGRRGTDQFTSGHSVGDLFVLLGTSTVGKLSLTLGQIGQTRYYRGVTAGQQFEDSDVVALSSPGADLKPYAPAQLSVASGGPWASADIVLDWERRTRIGGELRDGTGTVPLMEDTEGYELEVLDDADAVVRTVTGIASTQWSYTVADQTADFPGEDATKAYLHFRVYQVSAQVGRGFPSRVAIVEVR